MNLSPPSITLENQDKRCKRALERNFLQLLHLLVPCIDAFLEYCCAKKYVDVRTCTTHDNTTGNLEKCVSMLNHISTLSQVNIWTILEEFLSQSSETGSIVPAVVHSLIAQNAIPTTLPLTTWLNKVDCEAGMYKDVKLELPDCIIKCAKWLKRRYQEDPFSRCHRVLANNASIDIESSFLVPQCVTDLNTHNNSINASSEIDIWQLLTNKKHASTIISGELCCGKTTLAKALCTFWRYHSCDRNCQLPALVLFIDCANLPRSDTVMFRDLLKASNCLESLWDQNGVDAITEQKQVATTKQQFCDKVKSWIDGHASQVLFLLDNYEQYVGSDRMSFCNELNEMLGLIKPSMLRVNGSEYRAIIFSKPYGVMTGNEKQWAPVLKISMSGYSDEDSRKLLQRGNSSTKTKEHANDFSACVCLQQHKTKSLCSMVLFASRDYMFVHSRTPESLPVLFEQCCQFLRCQARKFPPQTSPNVFYGNRYTSANCFQELRQREENVMAGNKAYYKLLHDSLLEELSEIAYNKLADGDLSLQFPSNKVLQGKMCPYFALDCGLVTVDQIKPTNHLVFRDEYWLQFLAANYVKTKIVTDSHTLDNKFLFCYEYIPPLNLEVLKVLAKLKYFISCIFALIDKKYATFAARWVKNLIHQQSRPSYKQLLAIFVTNLWHASTACIQQEARLILQEICVKTREQDFETLKPVHFMLQIITDAAKHDKTFFEVLHYLSELDYVLVKHKYLRCRETSFIMHEVCLKRKKNANLLLVEVNAGSIPGCANKKIVEKFICPKATRYFGFVGSAVEFIELLNITSFEAKGGFVAIKDNDHVNVWENCILLRHPELVHGNRTKFSCSVVFTETNNEMCAIAIEELCMPTPTSADNMRHYNADDWLKSVKCKYYAVAGTAFFLIDLQERLQIKSEIMCIKLNVKVGETFDTPFCTFSAVNTVVKSVPICCGAQSVNAKRLCAGNVVVVCINAADDETPATGASAIIDHPRTFVGIKGTTSKIVGFLNANAAALTQALLFIDNSDIANSQDTNGPCCIRIVHGFLKHLGLEIRICELYTSNSQKIDQPNQKPTVCMAIVTGSFSSQSKFQESVTCGIDKTFLEKRILAYAGPVCGLFSLFQNSNINQVAIERMYVCLPEADNCDGPRIRCMEYGTVEFVRLFCTEKHVTILGDMTVKFKLFNSKFNAKSDFALVYSVLEKNDEQEIVSYESLLDNDYTVFLQIPLKSLLSYFRCLCLLTTKRKKNFFICTTNNHVVKLEPSLVYIASINVLLEEYRVDDIYDSSLKAVIASERATTDDQLRQVSRREDWTVETEYFEYHGTALSFAKLANNCRISTSNISLILHTKIIPVITLNDSVEHLFATAFDVSCEITPISTNKISVKCGHFLLDVIAIEDRVKKTARIIWFTQIYETLDNNPIFLSDYLSNFIVDNQMVLSVFNGSLELFLLLLSSCAYFIQEHQIVLTADNNATKIYDGVFNLGAQFSNTELRFSWRTLGNYLIKSERNLIVCENKHIENAASSQLVVRQTGNVEDFADSTYSSVLYTGSIKGFARLCAHQCLNNTLGSSYVVLLDESKFSILEVLTPTECTVNNFRKVNYTDKMLMSILRYDASNLSPQMMQQKSDYTLHLTTQLSLFDYFFQAQIHFTNHLAVLLDDPRPAPAIQDIQHYRVVRAKLAYTLYAFDVFKLSKEHSSTIKLFVKEISAENETSCIEGETQNWEWVEIIKVLRGKVNAMVYSGSLAAWFALCSNGNAEEALPVEELTISLTSSCNANTQIKAKDATLFAATGLTLQFGTVLQYWFIVHKFYRLLYLETTSEVDVHKQVEIDLNDFVGGDSKCCVACGFTGDECTFSSVIVAMVKKSIMCRMYAAIDFKHNRFFSKYDLRKKLHVFDLEASCQNDDLHFVSLSSKLSAGISVKQSLRFLICYESNATTDAALSTHPSLSIPECIFVYLGSAKVLYELVLLYPELRGRAILCISGLVEKPKFYCMEIRLDEKTSQQIEIHYCNIEDANSSQSIAFKCFKANAKDAIPSDTQAAVPTTLCLYPTGYLQLLQLNVDLTKLVLYLRNDPHKQRLANENECLVKHRKLLVKLCQASNLVYDTTVIIDRAESCQIINAVERNVVAAEPDNAEKLAISETCFSTITATMSGLIALINDSVGKKLIENCQKTSELKLMRRIDCQNSDSVRISSLPFPITCEKYAVRTNERHFDVRTIQISSVDSVSLICEKFEKHQDVCVDDLSSIPHLITGATVVHFIGSTSGLIDAVTYICKDSITVPLWITVESVADKTQWLELASGTYKLQCTVFHGATILYFQVHDAADTNIIAVTENRDKNTRKPNEDQLNDLQMKLNISHSIYMHCELTTAANWLSGPINLLEKNITASLTDPQDINGRIIYCGSAEDLYDSAESNRAALNSVPFPTQHAKDNLMLVTSVHGRMIKPCLLCVQDKLQYEIQNIVAQVSAKLVKCKEKYISCFMSKQTGETGNMTYKSAPVKHIDCTFFAFTGAFNELEDILNVLHLSAEKYYLDIVDHKQMNGEYDIRITFLELNKRCLYKCYEVMSLETNSLHLIYVSVANSDMHKNHTVTRYARHNKTDRFSFRGEMLDFIDLVLQRKLPDNVALLCCNASQQLEASVHEKKSETVTEAILQVKDLRCQCTVVSYVSSDSVKSRIVVIASELLEQQLQQISEVKAADLFDNETIVALSVPMASCGMFIENLMEHIVGQKCYIRVAGTDSSITNCLTWHTVDAHHVSAIIDDGDGKHFPAVFTFLHESHNKHAPVMVDNNITTDHFEYAGSMHAFCRLFVGESRIISANTIRLNMSSENCTSAQLNTINQTHDNCTIKAFDGLHFDLMSSAVKATYLDINSTTWYLVYSTNNKPDSIPKSNLRCNNVYASLPRINEPKLAVFLGSDDFVLCELISVGAFPDSTITIYVDKGVLLPIIWTKRPFILHSSTNFAFQIWHITTSNNNQNVVVINESFDAGSAKVDSLALKDIELIFFKGSVAGLAQYFIENVNVRCTSLAANFNHCVETQRLNWERYCCKETCLVFETFWQSEPLKTLEIIIVYKNADLAVEQSLSIDMLSEQEHGTLGKVYAYCCAREVMLKFLLNNAILREFHSILFPHSDELIPAAEQSGNDMLEIATVRFTNMCAINETYVIIAFKKFDEEFVDLYCTRTQFGRQHDLVGNCGIESENVNNFVFYGTLDGLSALTSQMGKISAAVSFKFYFVHASKVTIVQQLSPANEFEISRGLLSGTFGQVNYCSWTTKICSTGEAKTMLYVNQMSDIGSPESFNKILKTVPLLSQLTVFSLQCDANCFFDVMLALAQCNCHLDTDVHATVSFAKNLFCLPEFLKTGPSYKFKLKTLPVFQDSANQGSFCSLQLNETTSTENFRIVFVVQENKDKQDYPSDKDLFTRHLHSLMTDNQCCVIYKGILELLTHELLLGQQTLDCKLIATRSSEDVKFTSLHLIVNCTALCTELILQEWACPDATAQNVLIRCVQSKNFPDNDNSIDDLLRSEQLVAKEYILSPSAFISVLRKGWYQMLSDSKFFLRYKEQAIIVATNVGSTHFPLNHIPLQSTVRSVFLKLEISSVEIIAFRASDSENTIRVLGIYEHGNQNVEQDQHQDEVPTQVTFSSDTIFYFCGTISGLCCFFRHWALSKSAVTVNKQSEIRFVNSLSVSSSDVVRLPLTSEISIVVDAKCYHLDVFYFKVSLVEVLTESRGKNFMLWVKQLHENRAFESSPFSEIEQRFKMKNKETEKKLILVQYDGTDAAWEQLFTELAYQGHAKFKLWEVTDS